METIDLIVRYFPDITVRQREQFAALPGLYGEWNDKINVVSRKDIDNLMSHHVLHSLAIAKVMPFKSMARVMDVGTGGGFPGIPLAILFPDVQFVLVDSIGKKIKVVSDVAQQLGLKNVTALHTRAEQVEGRFDFVVSRAVTNLSDFTKWVRGKFSTVEFHPLRNGILYLKGGDLTEELKPFAKKVTVYDIDKYFDDPFFETKKVIYLPFK